MSSLKAWVAAAGAAAAVTAGAANAADTMLSGTVYGDDNVSVYLSTSPSTLGTYIQSGGSCCDFILNPQTLTPGNTYYLQFILTGWGDPNRLYAGLQLSTSDFEFANGSQSIESGGDTLADFSASPYSGSWTTPTGQVFDEGEHLVWYKDPTQKPGYVCTGGCQIEVMTKISPTVAGVPEPAGWTLMIAGIGFVGGALRGSRAGRFAAV